VSRATIDQKQKSVAFQLINETELVIEIPYFWYNATVDPSYSILLEPYNGNCGGPFPENSNEAWLLGVVVASAAVGLVIIVTVVVILQKKQRRKSAKKLRLSLQKLTDHPV